MSLHLAFGIKENMQKLKVAKYFYIAAVDLTDKPESDVWIPASHYLSSPYVPYALVMQQQEVIMMVKYKRERKKIKSLSMFV